MLKQRHLDISKLEVGYCSGERMVAKLEQLLKAKRGAVRLASPETGIEGRANGYRSWQDCLVFPLKDRAGQIVSFYGRSIQAGATGRHFYTKDRQGLYPGYPPPDTKKAHLNRERN